MENNENKPDLKRILKGVLDLNCSVEQTLRNVISVGSNVNNDLECIVLERRSESSLSMGKDSANLLVDFKKTSAGLLSHLQNYEIPENPEFKEELDVDLGASHKTEETINSYIRRREEFNKYLKIIMVGIKKMAMNTKISSNDSGRHISLNGINSTTLSDDFDINNLHLATSSPMSSSSMK